MSWFSDIFSGGAAKLVEAVGSAADNLITSDEERAKLKNEATKLLKDFELSQLNHIAEFDKQITERHRADMTSDSWLSKNIRPLTLAFLVITTMHQVIYVPILMELLVL